MWVTLFIVFKLSHLDLPYFWDESYPYSFAIDYMLENGVGIFPSSIPPDLSTGHPVFFYFIIAFWVKVFENTLFLRHLIPLIISVCALLCLYYYSSKLFSKNIALYAVVIFSSHTIFVAQSSFVLPETLVTLLMIISAFCFINKQKIIFIISTSLLLLTKETSILFLASTGIFCLIRLFQKDTNYNLSQFIIDIVVLLIPILISILYFFVQYKTYGWFFYPRHVGYVDFTLGAFLSKLEGFTSAIFIYNGRNALSMVIIVALVTIIFFKKSIRNYSDKLLFFVLLICIFLFGSSVNFYSIRYILCTLPFIAIIAGILIEVAFPKKYISYIFILGIVAIQIFSTLHKRKDFDHSIGYIDAINVHQKTISFLEYNNMYERNICTEFLMMHNITSTSPRYLSTKRTFKNVSNYLSKKTEVFILTSCEKTDNINTIKADQDFELVKRFEKNNSWAEIYQRRVYNNE